MTPTRHRPGRGQPGLAIVEFAMVLPIVLVLMFAVVDFGRAVLTRQVLINLSREAANLSSRGTALGDTLAAVQTSAAPLDLQARGFVILTEVFRDTNGNLRIIQQLAAGSEPGASRVGTGVGNPAVLPSTTPAIPRAGQSLFVAEVFYRSAPITPVGDLLDIALGERFYDIAFF